MTSQSTRRAEPVRTCIGCRRRDLRANVLRVVAQPENDVTYVRVDTRTSLPGRGAWLHLHCVDQALARRAFMRAFRISGPLDLTDIEQLAHQMRANSSSNVDMESGLEADGHPMSTQR